VFLLLLSAAINFVAGENYYFLFDCPGQVELYTHHSSFRNIVAQMQKWSYRVRCPPPSSLPPPSQPIPSTLTPITALSPLSLLILAQITAVHLVDSFHCTDAARFVSIVLMSLSAMLQLELPHVNVLSKVDLIEKYGRLGIILLCSRIPAHTYTTKQFYERNRIFFLSLSPRNYYW
jgi:hypothetical protein